ncbi:MAG: AAA family ATPase, partial [Gemmatimonadota bacterium]|nr:AAA family ATPase [Gemmatimonadota bacterium]
GSGNFNEPEILHKEVMAQLDAIEEETGVESHYDTASARFRHIIQMLHRQIGQPVVVLIDEYDKPILDALEVPEIARANRDFLRGLYATIKDCDAHVRFTFLTGVSKFSKVRLFSGLNNLTDITIDPRYSAICGYTEEDLDTVFAPELPGLDRDQIRDWYNGYSWLGDEKVYNPFDILLLFRRRSFEAYWFETGTPTFLIETLFNRRVSSLELNEMLGSDELLSTFDVDHIATEALLFQTGYLTITEKEDLGGRSLYRLSYPNREVRQSLNESLLRYLVKDATRQMANTVRLYRLLEANDFAGLETLFHAFFASIPYEWYTNNDIASYEGYYASVFYSYFAGLGLNITVEDSSSHGRLDMAVDFNDNIYLFEFKVVEMASEGAAMAQLQEKGYADKYRGLDQPIHLIGVEFSKNTRNITAFEVARA